MRDLHQFVAYLQELCLQVLDVDQSCVSNYMDALHEKGKSAATISRCVASLKSFYNYAVSRGKKDSNPVANIHHTWRRRKRSCRKSSPAKRWSCYWNSPSAPISRATGTRPCWSSYATGIRVSELINLNLTDVNLPGGFIRCDSGGKVRIIPLYPAAVKALSDYIQDVRPKMVADPMEPSLFVNVSGERMSRQGFWKLIK